MSAVNGGIIFNQSRTAGGGGGVTGANNGLSLAGANVQLGGNPLIQDSTITLDGFFLELFDPVFLMDILFSPANNDIQLLSGLNSSIILSGSTGFSSFGDANFDGNGTAITVNDTNSTAQIINGGHTYLDFDMNTFLFRIGDISSFGSGLQIVMDDPANNLQVISGGNTFFNMNIAGLVFGMGDLSNTGNGLQLALSDAGRTSAIATTAGLMLRADQANELYEFGDVNGVASGIQLSMDGATNQITLISDINSATPTFLVLDGISLQVALETDDCRLGLDATARSVFLGFNTTNETRIELSDSGQTLQFLSTTNTFLNLNIGAGVFQIGDISTSLNGSVLVLSDTSQFLSFQSAASEFLRVDVPNGLYQMGDIGAAANGGKIELQDAANVLVLSNTANTLAININGVAGFTGTVTPVTTITVNNGIVTNVA